MTMTAAVRSKRMDEHEAAEYVKLSPATMERRRRLSLPPVYAKVGRRVIYDVVDLDNFIEAHKVKPNRDLKVP